MRKYKTISLFIVMAFLSQMTLSAQYTLTIDRFRVK